MPSQSRGLRTTTGCLTCRKRRVKCDETLPECKNCKRLDRKCLYAEEAGTSRRPQTLSGRKSRDTSEATTIANPIALPTSNDQTSSAETDPAIAGAHSQQPWLPFPTEQWQAPINVLPDENFFLDDNLFMLNDTMTNNFGPVEWYDLLAEDFQGQTQNSRWNFDITSLSRRQSPRQSLAPDVVDITFDDTETRPLPIVQKPWNTGSGIELKQEELVYFEHFIKVVAPILDLFDPEKHFANVVPHLALRNVGLLKSLLAVGACHMSIMQPQPQSQPQTTRILTPASSDTKSPLSSVSLATSKVAEQYYYETLQYLSQNLLYQAYTTSHEILATAIMISTYEMYGTISNSDHSNWDRHLRGAFWIQKTMGVSGESSDGLHRAIWWAWLRQDVWAAFRTGRPALTVHQPKIPMSALSSDELATRITYIAAKCVQFAATPKQGDIAAYIEAGETLMRILDTWKRYLPASFEPIIVASRSSSSNLVTDRHQAPHFWIHPPAHAAAIQTYHFARIIMILNQPSTGGLSMYQTRLRLLRESTVAICDIAAAPQAQNLPSAFASFQALYAGESIWKAQQKFTDEHLAALCAETQDKQSEILAILDQVLSISKFPSKSILGDLVNVWGRPK